MDLRGSGLGWGWLNVDVKGRHSSDEAFDARPAEASDNIIR